MVSRFALQRSAPQLISAFALLVFATIGATAASAQEAASPDDESAPSISPHRTFGGELPEPRTAVELDDGSYAMVHARFGNAHADVTVSRRRPDGTALWHTNLWSDLEHQATTWFRSAMDFSVARIGADSIFVGVPGGAAVVSTSSGEVSWRVRREFSAWYHQGVDVRRGRALLLYARSEDHPESPGELVREHLDLETGDAVAHRTPQMENDDQRAWLHGDRIVEAAAGDLRIHTLRDDGESAVRRVELSDTPVSTVEFLDGHSAAYVATDDVYLVDLDSGDVEDVFGVCSQMASLHDADVADGVRQLAPSPCTEGIARHGGGRPRIAFFSPENKTPQPWLVQRDRLLNLADGRSIEFDLCEASTEPAATACPGEDAPPPATSRCSEQPLCEDITVSGVAAATPQRLVLFGSYFPGMGRHDWMPKGRTSEPGLIASVTTGRQPVEQLLLHTPAIADLAFSPDGAELATAHETIRHALRVWDVDERRITRVFPTSRIRGVGFDSEPDHLLAYGKLGPPAEHGGDPPPVPLGVQTWSLPDYEPVDRRRVVDMTDGNARDGQWSFRATVHELQRRRREGTPVGPFEEEFTGPYGFADGDGAPISISEHYCRHDNLVAGRSDGDVVVWNSRTSESVATLDVGEAIPAAMAFEPGNCRLAVVTRDPAAREEEPPRNIQLWEIDSESGAERLEWIAAPPHRVELLEGLPDGAGWVMSGSEEPPVVLAPDFGAVRARFTGIDSPATAVAVDEVRHRLALGHRDGRVSLWNLPEWEQLRDTPATESTQTGWEQTRHTEGPGLHRCEESAGVTAVSGALTFYARDAMERIQPILQSRLLEETIRADDEDDITTERPGIWVGGWEWRTRSMSDAVVLNAFLRSNRREILEVDEPEGWQVEIPCALSLDVEFVESDDGETVEVTSRARLRVRRPEGAWREFSGDITYGADRRRVVFETSEVELVWEAEE